MAIGIETRDLFKSFPGRKPDGLVRAVDGVSLSIEPGELFFLLGPSGCGKTTLLRMVAGFIDPDAGSIHFGGRDITRVPPNRRNAGMVFQSYALWPHMSVERNVAFGLSVRHVSSDESSRRVREALAQVRMEEYASRKPTELSGGQQQRVALARALVIRPDVLLLDEPLSNLDARLRVELRAEIRRVSKEAGTTAIYVTHDQKEALSMADRLAIMRDGKVVQVGTPRDLYEKPGSRFVAEFLGEANFIAGEIASIDARGEETEIGVRTGVGVLRARGAGASGLGIGSRVLCAIRPEALRLDGAMDAENSIAGMIRESIYLGESAQHVVATASGAIRASEANPHEARTPGPARLSVRARDIAVLPEEA